MKNDGGSQTSFWTATADIPPRPQLTDSQRSDVCVVGAGIAGLTVAYSVLRAGKSVVVVDDGPIAGGETGRTTAHLSNALDDRYFELERLHGERGARLAAESHTEAIRYIETIVGSENIDCDFRRLDGFLMLAPEHEEDLLDMELEAAGKAGVPGIEKIAQPPAGSGPCLRFPDQAQFHIVRYMAGLADAIERLGGRIYTRTKVSDFDEGERPLVRTETGGTVQCQQVVFATNSPINNRVTIHTKQEPYRTYVIGCSIPRGTFPTVLLWDTADPYHYLRIQAWNETHDILIVGGEDHRTGETEDGEALFASLEKWTRTVAPGIEGVEFQWSGQVMEPVDGLGFIGKNPGSDNVYIVTGDSGNGMTHGTLAGLLIRDLIAGAPNPWAELYDPSRKTLKAAADFARFNLNVAKHYLGVVTAGKSLSVDDVTPGTGAVLRRGVQKVAVYCSPEGSRHEMSAVCTHLGCIVDWNDTEKTWDCPCHGSRFSATGDVINGPANTPLAAVEPQDPPVAMQPAAEH